ncbi:MAG: hypothetical protein CVU91_01510 [Firmicutes bacterium HGW-Firmicutes-16]|nr:MAG: hypothetical protein CVU91_01510 [Firmicutes bacterium HGW-Firmicutes-16]
MKHIKNLVLSILILSLFTLAIPMQALAEDVSDVNDPELISANSYTDIAGKWFEKHAEAYGYSDIFSDGSGLFHPDQAITRMEFARMLHKALNININYFAATNIGEYYKDVKNSDTGASALYDLVTIGIIDTKDNFRPTATLDRDDMMHFVMNAFKYYVGDDFATTLMYFDFYDNSDIRPEYAGEIQTACNLRLVNGRGDNRLFPRAAATRAEAVTITGKLVELLKLYDSDVSVKASTSEENGGLRLSLTIVNNSDKTITINHSSQQLFDFKVFDKDGNSLYCWSATRMFAQVVTKTPIAPGKEIVLSDLVDSATYGTFKNNMNTVVGYITGSSDDFTINTNGYSA